MIPGASALPWQYQLLFWALMISVGFLAGICAFWLKRYLDGNDARVSKAIEGLAHQERRIVEIASDMKIAAAEHRSDSDQAMKDLLRRMHELRASVENIKTYAHDAKTASMDAHEGVQVLNVEIRTLIESVRSHSRSLIAAQRVLQKHDLDIRTLVKQISSDGSVRISEIKKG